MRGINNNDWSENIAALDAVIVANLAMAIYSDLVVSVLVILGFVSNTAQSLRFDLQSGRAKCITEDIKSNSMTVGKYAVVNPSEGHPLPESHKLTVRVRFQ